MKNKTLLHEECGGLIEIFKPKNYGLCQECGKEGYFVNTKIEEDIVYVEFTKITVIRK